MGKLGKPAWNSGLTKETNEIINNNSINMKGRFSGEKNPRYRKDIIDKKEEIIKMYLNGLSLRRISHKFNCCPQVIRKILNNDSIEIRPSKRTKLPENLRIYNKFKKNKTYEELYGEDKAKEMKIKMRNSNRNTGEHHINEELINYNKKIKGKFLEEIHGEEKAKEIKEKMIGDKNPAWIDGRSFEPYTKEFNDKFRKEIRKRDNHICMKCGIHQEKLSRTLDVHHIDYIKENTFEQNCCALCQRCNVEVNTNRLSWTKFFQSLLSERYNYKYSENGDIILNLDLKTEGYINGKK